MGVPITLEVDINSLITNGIYYFFILFLDRTYTDYTWQR